MEIFFTNFTSLLLVEEVINMTSVCMATYNGERFIKEQIDSILCQLSPDDELIISDDESTDRTLDIIASYNDKRIKVLHHKKNPNLAKVKHSRNFYYATENFGNALKEARGDYIFLSDQDDVWKKDKVEKCLSVLKDYDCVVHNYSIIDVNSNLTKEQNFSKSPIHKTVLMNVMDNHFRGCCMAFKSEFLKIILPIPQKVIGHDYWIGTLITHFGKTNYIIEPLIKSRWYEESVSAKRKTSLLYKINFRFNLLLEIRRRIRTYSEDKK